jgi:lipopolysaccharide biosynthesis glycosyltransferase
MTNIEKYINKIIKYENDKNEKELINIAYGIDDNYVRCMLTSILSFKLNNINNNIIFHVITNGLNDENLLKIKSVSKKYKINIIIYILYDNIFNELPVKIHWSKAMYFRFILPEILNSIEKVFYFDADIICLKKAPKFFSIDLKENIVAAVLDVKRIALKKEKIFKLKENSYFNSGVLIINIKEWNKYKVLSKVIKCIKEDPKKYKHPDQDALNVVLQNKIKYIPKFYNCIDFYEIKDPNDIVLLHFANHPKPWNKYWFLNIIYNDFTKNIYSFYENKIFSDKKREGYKTYSMLIKWIIKFLLFKLIKRV